MRFDESLTAMVICRVIEGHSRRDICEEMDISPSAFHQILGSVGDWQMRKMWDAHKDEEFYFISYEQMHGFLMADCDYGKYRRSLRTARCRRMSGLLRRLGSACFRKVYAARYRQGNAGRRSAQGY
ncbi:MAG: hypothetical protein NC548_25255 [Lachnospiraceae bacterium]|nr:hypothetical protein [Lachnospiraceae bacterium]